MKNVLIISGFLFLAALIFFGGKLSVSGLVNIHLISNFLDSDIIRNNYLIFQGIIALLIIVIFTYSGKLFYEWMDKEEE